MKNGIDVEKGTYLPHLHGKFRLRHFSMEIDRQINNVKKYLTFKCKNEVSIVRANAVAKGPLTP